MRLKPGQRLRTHDERQPSLEHPLRVLEHLLHSIDECRLGPE